MMYLHAVDYFITLFFLFLVPFDYFIPNIFKFGLPLTYHNPPLSGVLADTRSFLHKSTILGLSVFIGTPPRVYSNSGEQREG